jgi:hypothetical protein
MSNGAAPLSAKSSRWACSASAGAQNVDWQATFEAKLGQGQTGLVLGKVASTIMSADDFAARLANLKVSPNATKPAESV